MPANTRAFLFLASTAVALSLAAKTAGALTIDDTFLTTGPNAFTGTAVTQAQVEAATTQIASLFSNPITVNIVFGASASLTDGAQSNSSYYSNSYATYTTLLATNALLNPANTTLTTAVANLPFGNDSNRQTQVVETAPQLRANGQVGDTGEFNSSGVFVGAGGNTDGIVVLGTTAALSAVFHEVDEVLGGGGAGSSLGAGGANQAYCIANWGSGCYGGTDLYRYSAAFTPSFATGTGQAYLSVDGGLTSIAYFNQQTGVGDAGDFVKSPCLIQSWQVCGMSDDFTIGSAEYEMLAALGYDPISQTPLPPALPLFASGLGAVGLFGWRRKRRAQAVA